MAKFGDRIIVLIDMDCFFCQVEVKLQPEYKGKPLAVVQYNQWRLGGIIAVNYEAREFGITRHMRGDEAKEKCPDIVLAIVPCLRGKADTSRYRTAGRSVIEVLKRHCNTIERASVDEAYLDITQLVDERIASGTHRDDLDKQLKNTYVVGYSEVGVNDEEQRVNGVKEWLQNAEEVNDIQAQRLAVAGVIVEEIREDIYQKTEYRCSAGISYNKILAKLACGLHKPNRQTVLPYAAVPSLFSTLPVKKVRNLGGKFGDIVIESLKCNVMADLLQFSLQYLQNRFDEKTGLWLYNIARGIDNEPVTTRLVSKSIGACKKFPGKQALTSPENLKHWLGELSAEVCERLEQDQEENERRATLLTVSYHYEKNDSIVSQSKSLPISSYKQERMQNQCFDVVSKIQHPIAYLGVSAGKFVRVKGSENLINFFKSDRSDKSTSEDTQCTLVEEIQDTCPIEEETAVSEEPVVLKKKLETTAKKSGSFFKFINNIPSPKPEEKPKVDVQEMLKNSDSLKSSFFANILKESCEKVEEDADSSANEIPSSSTIVNEPVLEPESCKIKLQDIFPNLDNIDPEILSCLPLELQKEASAMMKSKAEKKVSPKVGRPKGSKAKVQKQKKSEGKSINNFFIKTSENGEGFQECEQCGQMISLGKFDEHKDYHVAQNLQKVFNRVEPNEEGTSKRKSTSAESSPKKKLANERRLDYRSNESVAPFLMYKMD